MVSHRKFKVHISHLALFSTACTLCHAILCQKGKRSMPPGLTKRRHEMCHNPPEGHQTIFKLGGSVVQYLLRTFCITRPKISFTNQHRLLSISMWHKN